MAILLWGIMMLLVVVTVAFMWFFQIYFMERNYVSSNIAEVQDRIDPVVEDLATDDLAYNEQLLSYLTHAADGKLLIVDKNGSLAAMYTYGHPIDLESDSGEIAT